MKKTINLAMAAAFGLMLFAAAPVASAQDDIGQKIIASVEYENADVREALRALFKNVNVSYAIDPDVQGTVTVSLKNVPFDTALQHITRQVDSTYQVQGGVYRIMRRIIDTAPGGETTTPGAITGDNKVIRRIKIRSADPMYIAAMLGTTGGSQDFSMPPERSTIINGAQAGGGGGGGGLGGGGLGGGGLGGGGLGGGGFGGGGLGGGGLGGGGFGGGGGMGGGGRGGGGFGGGGRGGGFGG